VCPWQRFAVETRESDFFPIDLDRAAPPLEDLLRLTPDGFDNRFGGRISTAGLCCLSISWRA